MVSCSSHKTCRWETATSLRLSSCPWLRLLKLVMFFRLRTEGCSLMLVMKETNGEGEECGRHRETYIMPERYAFEPCQQSHLLLTLSCPELLVGPRASFNILGLCVDGSLSTFFRSFAGTKLQHAGRIRLPCWILADDIRAIPFPGGALPVRLPSLRVPALLHPEVGQI